METKTRRSVYLDLNHWYALGEALANTPQDPGHKHALNLLVRLVEQGEIILPLSTVTYMELAENPRDHIREKAAKAMVLLSRFTTMAPTGKILDAELAQAFHQRFGRPAFPASTPGFGYGVGHAFGEPFAFRLKGGTEQDRTRLERQLGQPVAKWEAQINAWAEYQLLVQPPAGMRDQIPNYNAYAARDVAERQLASFNVMVNTLRTNPKIAARPLDAICARQFYYDFPDNYARAMLGAGFVDRQPFTDKEELTDFLLALPSRRVTTMMQFHYLKDVDRDWKINDLRDIDALSVAIPYCDLVATDGKAWDTAVNRAHLDREFDTMIFRRLSDVVKHLTR
ncbi:hypothetical protein ACIOHS_04240 [Streptomyces sp. NPDC088253]|uniref:hypothetical protein n=1 Tax=Streptomyces sp. NPDC088253 TaxID=3365846 RepID=UPI0037FCD654